MTTNSDTWNPREEIDKYEYGEQSSRFRHLLWYCAGADVKLLERCPQSERVKKEGIGGIVLATGALAFISGSYAFYTVFSTGSIGSGEDLNIFLTSKAMIFGFMWAFVIFNLDRFIVSSVSHGDGTSAVTWSEFWQALPRIFMAVIIGLCLSKPLEIRVMKTEIERKLHIDHIENQGKEKAVVEAKFEERKGINDSRKLEVDKREAKFEADISKQRSEVSAQEKIMNEELKGRNSSAGPGPGKNYFAAEKLRDEKARELDFLQKKYDEAKPGIVEERARLKAEMDKLLMEKDKAFEIIQTNSEKDDGLVKRITIAEEHYPTPSHILSLLLIIIEVSPIIFKMMLADGPYDRLVENQKRLSQARYAIEVHSSIDTQTGKVVTHGETYHQAEMLNNYEIGNLRVQSSATTKAQDAWLKDQLAEIEKNPHKYIKRDPEGSASS